MGVMDNQIINSSTMNVFRIKVNVLQGKMSVLQLKMSVLQGTMNILQLKVNVLQLKMSLFRVLWNVLQLNILNMNELQICILRIGIEYRRHWF